MRPYAIHGAGAVGSSLAGYLARRGHPVWMTARAPHVAAIKAQRGLRVRSREESFLIPVQAADRLPATLPPETVIFLTMQSPDVANAATTVAPMAGQHIVVTWQNGIRAEETAGPWCPRLLGGIVRFTSTLLEPGEVRLRSPGALIVGPVQGTSPADAGSVVEDLLASGFNAAVSPDIAAEKALKLLVNLVSGPAVLIRRSGPDEGLARVQAALLQEAIGVYEAAGVRAEPLSGIGQSPRDLLGRFQSGGSAPDTRGGIYNSTWQNLHHRRSRLENSFYHGEIVDLGNRHHLPTPVNQRAQQVLEEARELGQGPEPFDPAEFRRRFEDVVDFDTPMPEQPPSSGSAPEI